MKSVENDIEASCENFVETKANDVVEPSDMWQPVRRNLRHLLDCFEGKEVPESVIEGSLKYIEQLRRDLPRQQPVSTSQSPSPPQRLELQPPEPFTSSLLSSTSQASFTPTNGRISSQRRLLGFRSTKKRPLKKRLSLAKPTFHQEGAYLASFSLGDNVQIMNIHAKESDHSYSQMDADDIY